MSYLDMILNEASTPVAEKNRFEGSKVSRADKALAKAYKKQYGKKKSSTFSVGYKSSSATSMETIKARMDKLAAAIATGMDSQGRKLNPDKIRRYKQELSDLKRAYAALKASSKGKSSRTDRSFGYTVSKKSASRGASSNTGNDRSRGSSDVAVSGKDKIYLEGYMTALDEMGLLDEDYEEDFYDDDYDAFDEDYFDEEYDDYDDDDFDDDMDEAYNEGYMTALDEMGLLD